MKTAQLESSMLGHNVVKMNNQLEKAMYEWLHIAKDFTISCKFSINIQIQFLFSPILEDELREVDLNNKCILVKIYLTNKNTEDKDDYISAYFRFYNYTKELHIEYVKYGSGVISINYNEDILKEDIPKQIKTIIIDNLNLITLN